MNTDLELDQLASGVIVWGSSDVSNVYSGGTENLSESIFNLQNRQVLNINPSLRLPDRVNFNTNVQNIRQICENITDEDIEYCGNINNMIRDTWNIEGVPDAGQPVEILNAEDLTIITEETVSAENLQIIGRSEYDSLNESMDYIPDEWNNFSDNVRVTNIIEHTNQVFQDVTDLITLFT